MAGERQQARGMSGSQSLVSLPSGKGGADGRFFAKTPVFLSPVGFRDLWKYTSYPKLLRRIVACPARTALRMRFISIISWMALSQCCAMGLRNRDCEPMQLGGWGRAYPAIYIKFWKWMLWPGIFVWPLRWPKSKISGQDSNWNRRQWLFLWALTAFSQF